MLPSSFDDRATRLADVAFSERRKAYETEQFNIIAVMNARGIPHSSHCMQLKHEAAEREFILRAGLIWTAIQRAFESLSMGPEVTSADELRTVFVDLLNPLRSELRVAIDPALQNLSMVANVNLESVWEELIEKYEVEIDVYLDGLRLRQRGIGTDHKQAIDAPLDIGAENIDLIVREYERFFSDPRQQNRILKPLYRGAASENLRNALRVLGFDAGFGDEYDERLREAVLGFQRANSHSSLDGFCGPGTRALVVRRLVAKQGVQSFTRMTDPSASGSTTILFLAADPSNLAQLRVGEELREIQEKIQLSKDRERFALTARTSLRIADISQSLLDLQPQVVHFAGHGTASGELCFETVSGQSQPVPPDALSALFAQFSGHVHLVVLNACYSERQALAIGKHISTVIGMKSEIGDVAAIAFSVGFYQALGAGRTIEDAYELGKVQIMMQGTTELVPIFVRNGTLI